MPLKNFYLFALSFFVFSAAYAEGSLTVSLADPAWNGKKVLADQVCNKFGGNQASSPMLTVEGIPAEADALVLSFNDESYTPMDKGGHGIVRFAHNKGVTAQVPAVPGETDSLPSGLNVVTKHRGTGWSGTGGAYLPPCSGGRGNTYSIDVSAVKTSPDGASVTLAKGKIVMGKY